MRLNCLTFDHDNGEIRGVMVSKVKYFCHPPRVTLYQALGLAGGGANGEKWRKMAKNGEKWRKMAMANSAFSFVKFAIFCQFLILEFHI